MSDGEVLAIGSFRSTYPVDEVHRIIYSGVEPELSEPGFVERVAPILRGIYLSEVAESRIVVTAGNRIDTLFELIIDLHADAAGTTGDLSFVRKQPDWHEAAVNLVTGIKRALVLSSASEIAFVEGYVDALWE